MRYEYETGLLQHEVMCPFLPHLISFWCLKFDYVYGSMYYYKFLKGESIRKGSFENFIFHIVFFVSAFSVSVSSIVSLFLQGRS